ncbi:CREB-regulated transcription coactivator 2 isoform X3 [Colossoma macropomum]|uniref:CREB-regulated transcription coactivator 2 isoform X3 n=1 Tax=Colossoma macropomum TaxID=42526 RepID=UPI0018649343|nr:CREB-regulated transcription coactivator 2 isoform X3 [Colossoma macropomum]
MNMAGKSAGAAGHGQWAGAGSASLTCNPRKFSEKIALHTQRQAEDDAAFQEVMMDITSTRIQAQRLRQAQNLASYYGGSLPNVNQITKCSAEAQQEYLRADHGPRDHRPIPPGRPSRRHADSAPYLSFHLSPPSGPSWRRHWSNRSVNGKSQVDQLPVTTLSRTNSDSALHTSVRVTYIRDSNPAQVQTACSRQSGTPLFRHPVPLIEETVQEEGKPPKSQKMSLVLSGCGTPGNCVFPSPDLSCSLPNVPSLSTSGSLPDLSSLHLPSTVPEVIDPEAQSHTSSLSSPVSMHHLPTTATHSAIMTDTDFPRPSLSSSLQASTSNPSRPSSLSNPNLQATLSSHSLVDSFSSTSLSLSNSSLHSSVSSQSLRSSLSSSSLSNQSAQSADSHCSYSSGIGGSFSSLSCSPHASGQGVVPRNTSSSKRTQLNPLIVPSGGESLWQQPKQLSPNVSSTFSSIAQGVPLDTTKVQREAKPSIYHYSHLPPTGHPMAYQSLQHHQPEGWDQSRQDTRKQCQQQVLQSSSSQLKSQPQYSQHSAHSKAHLNPHPCPPQQQLHEQKQDLHHQYQQVQQQSLHQQYQPSQQYLQQQPQHCQSQHNTQPLQHQQQYQELNQGWNSQLQLMHHNQYQQQYQYQSQPEGPPGTFQKQQPCPPPTVMASQDEDAGCWQNQVNQHNQHNMPNMGVQGPLSACMHIKELPKVQSKMPVHDLRRERTTQYPKGIHSQRDHLQLSETVSAQSLNKEFGLHNKSYVGLHLTPSQTQALSQRLGHLHKEPADAPRISDSKCQDVEENEVPAVENLWHLETQSQNKEGLHSFSSTSTAVPSSWLDDDDLPDLPDSIPEFDLEPFALED